MTYKTFKSKRTGKQMTVVWGGGFKRFGLGFSVDEWMVVLDFGFVWIAVEY